MAQTLLYTTNEKQPEEPPMSANASPIESSVPPLLSPVRVSPKTMSTWLEADEAILVDCREDYEYAEEHIEGSVHHPLSRFDADRLRTEHPGKRLVFHCRSGKRSIEASNRFRQGDEPVFHLSAGIEGWKVAGRPVVRPENGPRLPIMRQVQIAAGALVVTGTTLGLLLSPWFLGLAGFVGAGLMFAGISGWCGMAKLLAVMPWNRC